MKPTKWLGFTAVVLAAVAISAVMPAQIVPQQKNAPFFKGDKKKNKDDDAKTRSVSGLVRDEKDNLAEGAVVQLKDTKSLQVRSFIVKEDGKYQFHGLSQEVDYQVKADLKNTTSDVKTLSVFDSRKAAVINLTLEPRK